MLPPKDILLGKLAVKRALTTAGQCQKAQRMAQGHIPPLPLGRVLIDEQMISPADLRALALLLQDHYTRHVPFFREKRFDRVFVNLAVSQRYIEEAQVRRAKAEQDRRLERHRDFVRLWKILIEQGSLEHEFVTRLSFALRSIVLVCDYCDTQFDRRKFEGQNDAQCRRCGCLLFDRGKDASDAHDFSAAASDEGIPVAVEPLGDYEEEALVADAGDRVEDAAFAATFIEEEEASPLEAEEALELDDEDEDFDDDEADSESAADLDLDDDDDEALQDLGEASEARPVSSARVRTRRERSGLRRPAPRGQGREPIRRPQGVERAPRRPLRPKRPPRR